MKSGKKDTLDKDKESVVEIKEKGPEPVICKHCGFKVPVPAGSCFTCPNCFENSGGCG